MKSRIFYGWYIVAASLVLTTYTSAAVVYGFTAFVDPFAITYGWSYAQISLAISLRGMETGALNPLVGFIVDRWSARRLMFIGTVLLGLGIFTLSRADNLAAFYLSFVFIGLSTSLAAFMVPVVVVARWFKKDIGKVNGVLAMGMGIGGILIPVLVKIIDTYGMLTTLIILAAGVYIIYIPLIFIFRDRPEDYGLFADGQPPGDVRNRHGLRTYDFSIGLREALKMRAFWQISIAFMIQMALMMAMQTHIMPYLNSLGIDRTAASVIAMSLPLISLGVRIPFGWLSDIFPKKYVIAVSIGLKGLSLFLFWLFGLADSVSLGLMILPTLIFGLGSGGVMAPRSPIVREYFGAGRFGTIFGLTSFFTMIGLAIGPFVAGLVFDSTGTYGPIWLMLGAAAAIGVILMVTVPSAKQPSAPLVVPER